MDVTAVHFEPGNGERPRVEITPSAADGVFIAWDWEQPAVCKRAEIVGLPIEEVLVVQDGEPTVLEKYLGSHLLVGGEVHLHLYMNDYASASSYGPVIEYAPSVPTTEDVLSTQGPGEPVPNLLPSTRSKFVPRDLAALREKNIAQREASTA